MRKLFLYLLLLACLVVAIYTSYLLFTSQTDPIIGSIVLAVDILVLFWNWSLVKKYRTSSSSVVVIFVLVALLAGTTAVYAGYEPAVEMRDNIVSKWQNIVSDKEQPATESKKQPDFAKKPIILKRNFLAGTLLPPKVIELNEVQRWHDSRPRQLEFESLSPPYVVNAAIKAKTSQVATSLNVRVYQKGDPYKMSPIPITTRTIQGMGGIQAFIIEKEGDFIIDVQSVGCEWWVIVGHESEAFRQ